MNTHSERINPDFLETQNCLIIPIESDLYDDVFSELQHSILEKLKNNEIIGVILDVSAVKIIDSFNLNDLIKLQEMTRLMGKEMIIVGMQPGIAAALTDFLNLELDKLLTFINIKAGIKYLNDLKK